MDFLAKGTWLARLREVTKIGRPSKYRVLAGGVVIAVLALQYAKNDVAVSPSSGPSPLSVRITGPDKVVQLGHGRDQIFVGCGFYVIWGDDSDRKSDIPFSFDCKNHLQHTYLNSGKYTVTVRLFHPGNVDQAVTDWEGTAVVTVK